MYCKKAGKGILKMNNITFQFPSSGKVYCKINGCMSLKNGTHCVSIPFERESVLQVWEAVDDLDEDELEFQFPSSGKVYCKRVV